MMSKIIPAALLLAIVIGLGQFVICRSEPQQDQNTNGQRLEVKKKDWAGNGVREFNLLFGAGANSLTVERITFSGLNSKRRGRVKVTVISGSPRAPWSKNKRAGWGYRAGLQSPGSGAYRPKIVRSRRGTKTALQFIYKNIPVSALGLTCGSRSLTAPLYVIFPGLPGPTRQLRINAPEPPLGACLGQGVKPQISLNQRIKRSGKKIIVFGRVTGARPQRVIVQLSNKSGSFRSQPRPRVSGKRFAVKFKLPSGRYVVKAGFKPGKWSDQIGLRVK